MLFQVKIEVIFMNEMYKYAQDKHNVICGRTINTIFDKDGYLKGRIEITYSNWKDMKMKGKFITKYNTLYFEGEWDEGSFNIKWVTGALTHKRVIIELEQYLNDNFKSIYLDMV